MYTITTVCPLPSSLSSLPCYEAIHHAILDIEEIIRYIEGQQCHLEIKTRFNRLPVFALNKGPSYFYNSIAAEVGVGTHTGIPQHCGDMQPAGDPEGVRRNYIEVTQIASANGGSYAVHGDYISHHRFSLLHQNEFSQEDSAIYFSCWRRPGRL